MENQANVSLSAGELELVQNSGWILTKNSIIAKVQQLMSMLAMDYQQHPLLQRLPAEVAAIPPKISKGEQYEGLPYVMLDLPRYFTRTDVLAIRTFFWWGHFFSTTLHLKGQYAAGCAASISRAMANGELQGHWINTSTEEWMHHPHESHMRLIAGYEQTHLHQQALIKISCTIPLVKWADAPALLQQQYQLYLRLAAAATTGYNK